MTSMFETILPPGMQIIEDFVDIEEEKALVEFADTSKWTNDLKRRVIHLGVRYDYGGRIGAPGSAPPLPDQITWLVDRVRTIDGMTVGSMAVIVNEYLPGQGISAHIDHPGWGPVVCTLSLGWCVPMTFEYGEERLEVELPIRSMAVLSGPSRSEWTHTIAARKSDRVQGSRVPRERRISFTFRTVQVGQ